MGVVVTLGVIALVALPFFIPASSSYSESFLSESESDAKVVIIDVKGEISNGDGSVGLLGGAYASQPSITTEIDQAIHDENVVGILLEMDTPGGEIVASDLINQKVYEARAAGKPVITYMQTLGASGGYYIAVASDYIFVNELTTTGSIGVYSVFQDTSGLMEKLGISQRVIKSGEFKTGSGLFDSDDDGEEDQIYERLIQESNEKFKRVIVEGRDMTIEEVDELADGRVFSGAQAVANGLVDEIGGYDEAVIKMKELSEVTDFSIVRYDNLDFLGSLFSVLSGFNMNAQLLEIARTEQGFRVMARME